MRTPLERMRWGAAFLAGVTLVGVCGYRLMTGEPWLASLYWYVITVSSVGYAEKSRIEPSLQAFSIAVIVIGLSAAVYTIGGFIQMMTEGEIERVMGVRRTTREIKHLKHHVVVCGYGRMGQLLCRELAHLKLPMLVVESNPERVTEAESQNLLVMNGDATEEDVLVAAGVGRAKTLVSALTSDANNVFITLTSRNLNPDLQIISRGEQPSSEKKLIQAGANRVVLPMLTGAQRIARMITRPHTADLIEQVISREQLDAELDELLLPADSPLVSKTVRDAEAHRRHRLLVVAVSRAGGEMVLNPDADHVFEANDTMMVMGHPADIERFRTIYGL